MMNKSQKGTIFTFKIEFWFLIDLLHCYIAGVLIKNNFVDLFCEQMFQQQVMIRVDLDG